MPRRRDALTALFALCATSFAAQASTGFPGATWQTRAPESSGWSADKLRAADAIARTLGSDAVLVVHRGAIVHAFGDITKPMNLYSARKSVLSVLYGIHLARGEIDLHATIDQLGIGDKQGLSDGERTATVLQLLQARSGIYHPAAYETASMAAKRPARGSHAPGAFWYYNNWDFNALGTIFRQRTGRTVFEALDAEPAKPLQFEDFRVEANTKFHFESVSEHPAYLMFLSARDLARLGLLMARDGRWDAQQIVPSAWVDESTTPSSVEPSGLLGYGYLWWVPQRAWPFWTRRPGQVFFAWGNLAQLLIVDRERDLVIVHRVDGSRWFRHDNGLDAIAPLLEVLLAAAPAP